MIICSSALLLSRSSLKITLSSIVLMADNFRLSYHLLKKKWGDLSSASEHRETLWLHLKLKCLLIGSQNNRTSWKACRRWRSAWVWWRAVKGHLYRGLLLENPLPAVTLEATWTHLSVPWTQVFLRSGWTRNRKLCKIPERSRHRWAQQWLQALEDSNCSIMPLRWTRASVCRGVLRKISSHRLDLNPLLRIRN